MPKSSKTESGSGKKGKESAVAAKEAVAPTAVIPVVTPPEAPKPAKAKAADAKKPADTKKKKPEEKAEKPKKAAKAPVVISNDDIGLRAYYIAERRRAMGWPGDETSDWVEAERQIRKEAGKK